MKNIINMLMNLLSKHDTLIFVLNEGGICTSQFGYTDYTIHSIDMNIKDKNFDFFFTWISAMYNTFTNILNQKVHMITLEQFHMLFKQNQSDLYLIISQNQYDIIQNDEQIIMDVNNYKAQKISSVCSL